MPILLRFGNHETTTAINQNSPFQFRTWQPNRFRKSICSHFPLLLFINDIQIMNPSGFAWIEMPNLAQTANLLHSSSSFFALHGYTQFPNIQKAFNWVLKLILWKWNIPEQHISIQLNYARFVISKKKKKKKTKRPYANK